MTITDDQEFKYQQKVRVIEPGLSMTEKIGSVRQVAFRSNDDDDDLRKRYRVATGDYMNEEERWFFAEDLEPVTPRGRDGGRPLMADEPMKRRNISISDTDWDYAASIGDGASDGIRVALEYHRSASCN